MVSCFIYGLSFVMLLFQNFLRSFNLSIEVLITYKINLELVMV